MCKGGVGERKGEGAERCNLSVQEENCIFLHVLNTFAALTFPYYVQRKDGTRCREEASLSEVKERRTGEVVVKGLQ